MRLKVKNILYMIFAMFVNIYRIRPVVCNRYCFIMTHDTSEYGNVGAMKKYILEQDKDIEYIDITKNDYKISTSFKQLGILLKFFFIKSYWIATSEYIFLDNAFLPLAYCNLSKKAKVIQLWHGCNAIKKFGQSYNTGLLKKLEKKLAEKYTYLVLNSENTREKYKEAFGVDDSKILVTGSPRVDIFFDEEKCSILRSEFYKENTLLEEKKIILYAPTFRDDQSNKLSEELYQLADSIYEDSVILLRLHPSLNESIIIPKKYKSKIINVSGYNNLVQLLLVSDVLITDYSSIIYEYSILERPMIFYSYDLKEYSENGRGFYEDYENYVPGTVCYSLQDLIIEIRKLEIDIDKVTYFKIKNYEYRDGKNIQRILSILN